MGHAPVARCAGLGLLVCARCTIKCLQRVGVAMAHEVITNQAVLGASWQSEAAAGRAQHHVALWASRRQRDLYISAMPVAVPLRGRHPQHVSISLCRCNEGSRVHVKQPVLPDNLGCLLLTAFLEHALQARQFFGSSGLHR